jgi:hypothetical protein
MDDVQQAIQNLRQDIAAAEERLRAEHGRVWADQRDEIQRHSKADDKRFEELTENVNRINTQLANWIGKADLLKWALTLGIPAIIGLLLRHGW